MMAGVEVVVQLADRGSARALATLHRTAAHAGFAHIFPPDAAPPTFEEDLARWDYWLGPDWEQGRRAYVAVARGRVLGVVLSGPDPRNPASAMSPVSTSTQPAGGAALVRSSTSLP
jgi:hypothetical protein